MLTKMSMRELFAEKEFQIFTPKKLSETERHTLVNQLIHISNQCLTNYTSLETWNKKGTQKTRMVIISFQTVKKSSSQTIIRLHSLWKHLMLCIIIKTVSKINLLTTGTTLAKP